MTPDVLIIGGGLAGLCCGRELARRHMPFQILEASDGVGGRLRTDVVNGYRLDRGLQNYLSSYPEGRRVLDYDALDLRPFKRAVLVRHAGRFHRLADPRSEFLTAVGSVFSPVGSFRDKLAAAKLTAAVRGDPGQSQDVPTLDFLRASGIGDTMLDLLFRPFLATVFLEPEMATSARFFRFVYHLFQEGNACVPAKGIQAIPDQIAAGLPAGAVRVNARVSGVTDTTVTLDSGERLTAQAVVVAADGPTAARLTGGRVKEPGSNGTTTLYYGTADPPLTEPILVLDGTNEGPVTALLVLTAAARDYAPPGKDLVAASVVGVPADDDPTLDRRVREQMGRWYGAGRVRGWDLLRVDRIPHSLPSQPVGVLDPWRRPVKLRDRLYVCGDHVDNASIDGAMTSGRRAAEAVAADLGR
jgi:phytoene dehydrogenase-like protein